MLPSRESRVISLIFLLFLTFPWLGLEGLAIGRLLQSVRAEVPDPTQIGVALLAPFAVTLGFAGFLWALVDEDWSFERHRAIRRLTLIGVSLHEWTHRVSDATDWPDRLVLRTANSREVAVRPSGLGSDTDDVLMPPELRRVIRRYLALPAAEVR